MRNFWKDKMVKKSPAKLQKCGHNVAILLAGGKGSRMRGTVRDKVMEPLMGKPVLMHSFGDFVESGEVAEVVFVCRDSAQRRAIKKALKELFPNLSSVKVCFAYGGAERQDSVLNGLRAATRKSGFAFIHDGARPLVGAENISKLARAAEKSGAAVLASKVADTIKRVPPAYLPGKPCKLADMDRKRLWAMQTPQVFPTRLIERAYSEVERASLSVTDDVAAAALCGQRTAVVENISPNPKITVPQDIAMVEFLIKFQPNKS